VPQAIYPESYHSSASSRLNSLLKTKLREHALILRKLSASLRSQSLSEETILSTLRSKKETLLKEVYAIMTATLGVPPRPDEKFVYEYYDEKGKVGRWEGTPLEFYKTFSSKEYPVRNLLAASLAYQTDLFIVILALAVILADQ
jgi:bleomycin hydrolase